MSLDTRYLHTFLAVCEEGGFRRASQKLHKTQPAISYQIRALEQQLNLRLFERVERSVILTPAGTRLRDFCSRYFSEFATLQTQFSRNIPELSQPLRIAAVSVFGRYVLFPLLCRKRFAHLRLEIIFRTAAEVFHLVERGKCDLGAAHVTKVSNYLRFLPAYEEELVLIAPPRFPVTRRELKRLATYESLPFITYEEGDYVFGKWFQSNFGAQPRVTSSIHHFEELEEVVQMVALGRGLSIVPADAAAGLARRKKLRIVRPLRKCCLNQEFLVVRAGAFLRTEVQQLLELVRTRAAALRTGRASLRSAA